MGQERGRLKPRLNGLWPQNPPSRVAEICPRRSEHRAELGSGQSAQGGLRGGAQRGPSGGVSTASALGALSYHEVDHV